MIKCEECGREIPEQSQQCMYCGYPISEMQGKDIQTNQDNRSLENNTHGFTKRGFRLPNTSKKRILLIASIAVIILTSVVITATIVLSNTLNSTEQYVCNIVSKYRDYLKDPSSLVIRGDIAYVVESEELDRYVFFTAAANNSYGAKVSSMPVFKEYTYLTDYKDDDYDIGSIPTDREERAEYHARLYEIAHGRVIVSTYNLYKALGDPSAMANDEKYREVVVVSGKKIASHLHCEWTEN